MKKEKRIVLSDVITPKRYKIKIKPNFEDHTFSGEEMVSFVLKKKTNEITLHSKDLEIFNIKIRSTEEEFIPLKKTFNNKKETVSFVFKEELPKGIFDLFLEFRGKLAEDMRGFYKSRRHGDDEKDIIATTQFESTDARRAFPCFDEPHQKAIFDVTMIVPKGHIAISNTMPIRVDEHEGEYKVVEFSSTPKMSTYLLAFISGKFDVVEGKNKDGVLVRVFGTPGKSKHGEFALEVGKKALEFYSDYFGIKYPLPVLDMVAIPDFAAGAMENWGAITYHESALLVDPDHTSEEARRWVALVVAHEIAHQWFGNLVTMKWWNDLWLNEGFASYVEYLAVDHIFPEWKIWEDFSISEMSPALKADSFFDTHALEVKVNNPGEVSEIFDHISYRKGASLIRMIHEYLGDKNFQKGLRIYLKRHSYGNAETKDLWKAFEEASGVPINKIMGSWTKNVGYPVLSVELNKKVLKLKQERFLLLKSRKSGNNVWNIPVKNFIDGKKFDFVMDLKNKKVSLKFEPRNFLKVNYGDSGFYRVFYSKSLFDSLCVAIKGDQIPLLDLVGIVRDYFSLSESQHVSVTDFFKLVEILKLKNNYILWVEVLKGFSKIGLIFNEEKWIGDYKKYVKKFISPVLNSISWLKKKDEPLENGFLRDMLIANAGFFGDEDVVRKSQDLFKNFFENDKYIDKDIRASVYRVVAYYGGHEEYKKFINLYKKALLSEEKSRIASALSCFRQKDILKDVLEFSLSKHVKRQDFREFFGPMCRNASGGVLAWNFFKENWQKILEAFGVGGHKLPILLSYLSFIVDENVLSEIKTFFKLHKVEGTKRTIGQVIESIQVSLSFKKNHSLAIENWLKNRIQ